MAKYTYTIRMPDGKQHAGTVEADTAQMAAAQVRSGGGVVTSLEEAHGTGGASRKWTDIQLFGVPLKEKVLFSVNLSVMVESGLSISRALENLTEQTKSKATRAIVADLFESVVRGTGLSDAMAKHPQMFDELFVNMVRVGEIGGNLDDSLKIVAAQLEKEQALKSRVRGAMMYPSIVMIAMIGIAVLMLTYILPQIMGVFGDMNVKLPASTQFIINLSDGLRAHWLWFVGGAAGVIMGLIIFLRTQSGKVTMSHFTTTAPIVKSMAIAVNCARFARIHSSLLRSGVSVIQSLTIVRDTLTNTRYKAALQDAIDSVERGVALGDIIRRYPKIFPVMVPQMIDVGEETGKTGVMLLKIAEFYEEYVDQMTKNMSSIIEPLLMLIIGGGVGFFAVAMLKPMYSVLENIQ